MMNCIICYFRSVFPRVQVVASDRSDGTKELSYHGLSKRQVSQPFTIHCSGNILSYLNI